MSEPKRMTDEAVQDRWTRHADLNALEEDHLAARASEAEKDKAIKELAAARDRVLSLLGHQEEHRNRLNSPGHAHQTPGRWDGTGTECALCIAWADLWRRLEAIP
jgi:hypothetical protein